ncbi:MAG: protease complex subunit PrcB family protein [Gammaproteobacteria bacterium]|nr:protease complex subunit PrcB family protein [Gammaproteobacteria bacterium]
MKIIFLLLLSGMIVSILGCVNDSSAEGPLPEPMFSEIQSGFHTDSGTYTKKQSKVIVNQADYDEELLIYTGAQPASIDFSTGKVLLVDMGQRNTGGYSIKVTSIDVNENDVIAHVNLAKPGENCIVTTVLENPYQFVFISTRKEILITERVTLEEC